MGDADEGHPDLGVLAKQLLEYAGYAQASCPELAASEVTEEYIHTGLVQPALVPTSATAVQQLGMVVPPANDLTVPCIAAALGYEREVCTCALPTPSSMRMPERSLGCPAGRSLHGVVYLNFFMSQHSSGL